MECQIKPITYEECSIRKRFPADRLSCHRFRANAFACSCTGLPSTWSTSSASGYPSLGAQHRSKLCAPSCSNPVPACATPPAASAFTWLLAGHFNNCTIRYARQRNQLTRFRPPNSLPHKPSRRSLAQNYPSPASPPNVLPDQPLSRPNCCPFSPGLHLSHTHLRSGELSGAVGSLAGRSLSRFTFTIAQITLNVGPCPQILPRLG